MKKEDAIVLGLIALGLISKKQVSQPTVQQPTPSPTPMPMPAPQPQPTPMPQPQPQPQPQELPCCEIPTTPTPPPTPQPQPQPAPTPTQLQVIWTPVKQITVTPQGEQVSQTSLPFIWREGKGWVPTALVPYYKHVIRNVIDRQNLNFGYIEFVEADHVKELYIDNTNQLYSTEVFGTDRLFAIYYKDPFGYLQMINPDTNGPAFITDDPTQASTSLGDMIEQAVNIWKIYYPNRVSDPNYQPFINDLYAIREFINKYKSQVVA